MRGFGLGASPVPEPLPKRLTAPVITCSLDLKSKDINGLVLISFPLARAARGRFAWEGSRNSRGQPPGLQWPRRLGQRIPPATAAGYRRQRHAIRCTPQLPYPCSRSDRGGSDRAGNELPL